MPLRSGYSKQSIDANIAELRRAGHSRDSAIFVAYAEARKCWFAKHPGGHLLYELAWPKSARRKQDYDKDGRPVATESALQSVRTNPVERGNLAYLASQSIPYGGRAGDRRAMEKQKSKIVAGLVANGFTLAASKRIVESALSRQASETRGAMMMFIQDSYLRDALPAQANPRAAPDVTRATALYRGFTGKAPKVLKKINVPPLPETALAIGKVFGIMYSVDATGERFHHEFKGTARPLLVVAADGRQVFLSGGAYTFTKRGFVDKK